MALNGFVKITIAADKTIWSLIKLRWALDSLIKRRLPRKLKKKAIKELRRKAHLDFGIELQHI